MAEKQAKKKPTFAEKLLFYTTASFILLATFSLFAFLFLVPFVIEPAFTTIFMEFDEEPAFCVTMSSIITKGATNCSSWTSCKEGCTKEVYECTQITVRYKLHASDWLESATEAAGGLEDGSVRVERALRPMYPDGYDDDVPPGEDDTMIVGLTTDNSSEWYYQGARLYPNVKGCGYPPMLNCSIWLAKYVNVGTNYSCYYSRIEPGLVITDLDMWQVYMNLVYAMAIPIPSFIVSCIYLIMAYFYIYNEDPIAVEETTPLPLSTPVPPPASGALSPTSEVFREDLASFGHQLKVAMADDISRDSVFTDSVPLSTNSINGNLNRMMTTSIITPPGPIAEV